MADQQVVFELNGKDASLVRAWMNARNSVAAYESQLGKIDNAQRKNEKSANNFDAAIGRTIGSVGGMVSGWVSVEAVINAATSAVREFEEANKKAAQDSEEAAKKQEFRRKRLQIANGIGPLAAKEAQEKLRGIANRSATSNDEVTDIALMLRSSGAQESAALGGGTESIAKFIKSQGLKGEQVNAEEFTDSITKFILGQGKELNEENIVKLVSQLQSQGVKDTKFKIPDLKFWAKEAQSLKEVGGMSQEDVIAIAGQTSGALDPEHAGRQAREIIKNLAVAGSQKDRREALQKIGLKPEDVDMKGEDYSTALRRVKEGLDKRPEGERAGILNKLVEGANIGEFYALANGEGEISTIKKGLSNSTLDEDFNAVSTGRGAGETRLQNQNENLDADRGSYANLYRQAFEAELKEKSQSAMYRQRRLQQYDAGISRGFTPEQSTKYEYGQDLGNNLGLGPIIDEIIEGPTYRDEVSAGTEKRFKSAVGGDAAAEEIRKQSKTNDINQQGEQLKRQLEAARKSGDPELYSLLRKQIDELAGMRADLTRGKAPSVNVVMPGQGAPAKPVAAAGIGPRSNRPS